MTPLDLTPDRLENIRSRAIQGLRPDDAGHAQPAGRGGAPAGRLRAPLVAGVINVTWEAA